METKLVKLPHGVTLPAIDLSPSDLVEALPGGWNKRANHCYTDSENSAALTTINARLGTEPILEISEPDLLAAYAKALKFQAQYDEAVKRLREIVLKVLIK